MSDCWIVLIPEDPSFVPDEAMRARARERLVEIAPDASEVRSRVFERIQFFDCGGNFERILCPSCGLEIAMDWWQERMSEDYDGGFRLASYPTPCCRTQHTLHELTYEWPQGFARFALDAMNPSFGKLEESDRRGIEEILGTELRVINRRI